MLSPRMLALTALLLSPAALGSSLTPTSATRVLRTYAYAQYFDDTSGRLEDIISDQTWTCEDLEPVDGSLRSQAMGLSRGEGFSSQYSTFSHGEFRAEGTALALGRSGSLSTDAQGRASSGYSTTLRLDGPAYVRLAGRVQTLDVDAQGVPDWAIQVEATVRLFGEADAELFGQTVTQHNLARDFDRVLLLAAGEYRLECLASSVAVASWEFAGGTPDGRASFSCNFNAVPAPATLLPLLFGPLAFGLTSAGRRRRSLTGPKSA